MLSLTSIFFVVPASTQRTKEANLKDAEALLTAFTRQHHTTLLLVAPPGEKINGKPARGSGEVRAVKTCCPTHRHDWRLCDLPPAEQQWSIIMMQKWSEHIGDTEYKKEYRLCTHTLYQGELFFIFSTYSVHSTIIWFFSFVGFTGVNIPLYWNQ